MTRLYCVFFYTNICLALESFRQSIIPKRDFAATNFLPINHQYSVTFRLFVESMIGLQATAPLELIQRILIFFSLAFSPTGSPTYASFVRDEEHFFSQTHTRAMSSTFATGPGILLTTALNFLVLEKLKRTPTWQAFLRASFLTIPWHMKAMNASAIASSIPVDAIGSVTLKISTSAILCRYDHVERSATVWKQWERVFWGYI